MTEEDLNFDLSAKKKKKKKKTAFDPEATEKDIDERVSFFFSRTVSYFCSSEA